MGAACTLAFLAAAVVLMAAFVGWERRVKMPLIPLELFRSASLSAGVVLVILGFFALFGVLFFMTLYLQRIHGYSPVQSGVRLLPLTGVFTLSAPLGGALTARLGPRPPLFIGMALMGVSFLGLSGSTQAIVGNAPVERAGVAGGIQQTGNQLGGVIGTSVLGTVIVVGVGSHLADRLTQAGVPHALVGPITHVSHLAFLDGLHRALLVGALVAFAGALLALLVRRGHEVDAAGAAA